MPAQTIKEEMAKVRKEIAVIAAIVGVVVLAAILVTGWFGDHRSCLRSKPVRAAQIKQREINRDSIKFWEDRGEAEIAARLRQRVKADSHIRNLNCSRLLPGT